MPIKERERKKMKITKEMLEAGKQAESQLTAEAQAYIKAQPFFLTFVYRIVYSKKPLDYRDDVYIFNSNNKCINVGDTIKDFQETIDDLIAGTSYYLRDRDYLDSII